MLNHDVRTLYVLHPLEDHADLGERHHKVVRDKAIELLLNVSEDMVEICSSGDYVQIIGCLLDLDAAYSLQH